MPYSFSLAWSLFAVECEGCKKFLLPSFFSLEGIIESVQERRRRSRNATHRNFCRTQRGLRHHTQMMSAKFSDFQPPPLVTVALTQLVSTFFCFGTIPPFPLSEDVICECSLSAHALLPSSSSDGTVKGAIKRAQNRTELKHRPPVQQAASSVFP